MNIALACASGMSTGMLVKKMVEAAKEMGLDDIKIAAYPVGDVETYGPICDAILLGPQVSYQEAAVREMFPDKPVLVINPLDYGTVNGKKVLEDTLKLLQ